MVNAQKGAHMTLETFFKENPRVALAFSGGVDSAYLLYAAIRCKADVKAYYVKSAFQPQFELEDARRLVQELGANFQVLELDVLREESVASNPENRCYFCKKMIFDKILSAAKADGFSVVMDGTNASDDAQDRPGMAALRELQVRSPLRDAGVCKAEIRRRSQEVGLFTFDKPAYACLATRIPTGERITKAKLERTERAEQYLSELGFRDFRVRSSADTAKIQIISDDFDRIMQFRKEIVRRLKLDYSSVVLDLEERG